MIIGLTGSFGTGKTTVAGMFRKLGARVIDADLLAREALEKGEPAYEKALKAFGDSLLDSRRNIDRRRLAGIVFKDRRQLKRLCGIIHPYVIDRIRLEIKKTPGSRVIVIDAPLLIEAGLDQMADSLVVVSAARKNQVRRCVAKFRMSSSDVRRRIESQMPLKAKMAKADFVIYNNGELEKTRKQVENAWRRILWT